jgi:hypothetical protein
MSEKEASEGLIETYRAKLHGALGMGKESGPKPAAPLCGRMVGLFHTDKFILLAAVNCLYRHWQA